MLSAIMEYSDVVSSIFMHSATMLCFHVECHYAECCYDVRHSADWFYAECHYTVCC
jgi:hypothetical protein